MARMVRYGKPRSTRFRKFIDERLEAVCKEKTLAPSDIIQEALECYLFNEACVARRRLRV